MSAQTPTRISLRRKRLNNEYRQANPSPKRMSPSTDNERKTTGASHQTNHSRKYETECGSSSVSSTFLTPKSCRRTDKKNLRTPMTARDNQASTSSVQEESDGPPSVEEFSPSQFSSSQIPSTQDCEVVWDCNSPGYTKEELKKMGGKSYEKSSNCSPMTFAPNRLLFGKYKRPPPPPLPLQLPCRITGKNSDVVAAELDSLLTKVTSKLIKEVEFVEDEEEPLAEDAVLSFLNVSSQPFDVTNDYNEDSSTETTKLPQSDKTTDTRQGSIADTHSNIDTTHSDVKSRPNEVLLSDVHAGKATFSSPVSSRNPVNKLEEKITTKNMSFSSMDDDDDDLFSESFLTSTQALEDAILKKDTVQDGQETPKLRKSRGVSPLSRIRRKTPVVFNRLEENKFDLTAKPISNNDNRFDFNDNRSSTPINNNSRPTTSNNNNSRSINNSGLINNNLRPINNSRPTNNSNFFSNNRPINNNNRPNNNNTSKPINNNDSMTNELSGPSPIIGTIRNCPNAFSIPEKHMNTDNSLSNQTLSNNITKNSLSNLSTDEVKEAPRGYFLSKQNKPRATFQIEDLGVRRTTFQLDEPSVGRNSSSQLKEPSGRRLSDLFKRKCSEGNNFVNNKDRNPSVDDWNLAPKSNESQKEKFSRSKSETGSQTSNFAEGGHLTTQQKINQNFSQELDDDDEIFASLVPALIEVEAKHTKLSTEVDCSSFLNNNKNKVNKLDDIFASKVLPSNKQMVNQSNFESRKPFNNVNLMKSIENNNKKALFGKSINTESKKSNFESVNLNKGSTNINIKTGVTPVLSAGTSNSAACVISSVNKKKDISRKPEAIGNKFDDDDDDLFLQDDVLDYISLMESQYVSSQQSSSQEKTSNANCASSVLSDGSLTGFQQANSSRMSRITSGQSGEQPFPHAHSGDPKRVPSSSDSSFRSMDTGSAFLKKELLKVGEAANKLNKALKGERIFSQNDSIDGLSDEEFLHIDFANSNDGKNKGLAPTNSESNFVNVKADSQPNKQSNFKPAFQAEKQVSDRGFRLTRNANINQNSSNRLQPSTRNNMMLSRSTTSNDSAFQGSKKFS